MKKNESPQAQICPHSGTIRQNVSYMEREGHNSLNLETLQLIKLGAGFEVEE